MIDFYFFKQFKNVNLPINIVYLTEHLIHFNFRKKYCAGTEEECFNLHAQYSSFLNFKCVKYGIAIRQVVCKNYNNSYTNRYKNIIKLKSIEKYHIMFYFNIKYRWLKKIFIIIKFDWEKIFRFKELLLVTYIYIIPSVTG